ncbi:MAG: WG repeat-containing protein [Alistipes sp.]|nr:WG repeat-containing protein [Alistipes sp.]
MTLRPIPRLRRTAVLAASAAVAFAAFAQTPEAVFDKLSKRYSYVGDAYYGRIVVCTGTPNAGTPGRFVHDCRFGYFDTAGQRAIPLQFDYASDFIDSVALVGIDCDGVRKFGYIGIDGGFVIPAEYDDAMIPQSGFLKVMRKTDAGKMYGYLSASGETVIPLEYPDIMKPSEGFICAARGRWVEKEGRKRIDGKYGYLDYAGNTVIPFEYSDAHSFRNGMAAVAVPGKYYDKWGFIDTAGRMRVECKYYRAEGFSEDRAAVARVIGGKLRYGFIDPDGEEVIPLKYFSVRGFRDGYTLVSEFVDGGFAPFYILDKWGNSQLRYPLYDVNDSGRYGHMTAAVADSTGLLRYGMLDKYARQIIPFEYDRITIFTEWDPKRRQWNEVGIAVKDNIEYSFDIYRGRRN